jgi:N-acetylglucosamine kinase-like BadF-type ATPase
MGIDAGGTTLQLCVVDDNMKQLAYVERKEICNPVVVGTDLAAELIQTAVSAVLEYVYLQPEDVAAVAFGIDGDPSWAETVLDSALPRAMILPTSAEEIQLVGGRGERYGVLLMSGHCSFAFGVNHAGQSAKVGGWGTVIGEEGSAYWLGAQALRAVAMASDRRGISTMMTGMVMSEHGLAHPREMSSLLRTKDETERATLVRGLASVVMHAAEAGDEAARKLIEQAAAHLGTHYRTVTGQLNMTKAPAVFAGNLLEQDTPLRTAVMAQLALREPPAIHYPPVMGAALLAQMASRDDVQTA